MSQIVIFICSVVFSVTAFAAPIPSIGTTEVFFSPRGGATEADVSEIRRARQEILVHAYSPASRLPRHSLTPGSEG
jgi:hypothetical protein